MVLVAFALVLAAAASFAAGIAMSRTNDTLVYLSIVFSLGAFVVLTVASIRSRPRGPRPQEEFAAARLEALERDIAAAAAEETVITPPPPVRRAPLSEAARKGHDLGKALDASLLDLGNNWTQDVDGRWQRSPADEALTDVDEGLGDLEQAFAVEEAADVDELIDIDDEPTIFFEPEPEAEVSLGAHGDPLEDDVLDLVEHEVDFDDVLSDPIDDYDDLTAAEIVPELAALDLDGLEWVWERESTGGMRPAVLGQVERLIVALGSEPPGHVESAATGRAPAKKAPVRKTSARKTTAKKTAKKTATKATKKTSAKKTAKKAGPRATRRA